MKTCFKGILSAAVVITALNGAALAQGTPQTVVLLKVDPQSYSTGYRASKVLGSTVYDTSNQAIGTINDLIIAPNQKSPYAVLSVGGFLGIGTKFVIVSYDAFDVNTKQIVLPGATKDSLTNLPDFHYSD